MSTYEVTRMQVETKTDFIDIETTGEDGQYRIKQGGGIVILSKEAAHDIYTAIGLLEGFNNSIKENYE